MRAYTERRLRQASGFERTKKEDEMKSSQGVASSTKKGLVLLLVLAALALALSGCISTAKEPVHSDVSLGRVHIAQGITAANLSGHEQTLDEYGVFYSASRQAVVDVSSVEATGVSTAGTIITDPGVEQVRVVTDVFVDPSQVGTPTVDLKNLMPGKTYYYRFYTIGHDNTKNDISYNTLYAVDSFKVADPTLKSMTTNRGKVSPTFSKTRYAYTKVLSAGTGSVKITVAPTVASSKVEMKVGTGAWATAKSKTASVSRHASKSVFIKVTDSAHHIVANYTVNVSRK
jgi:hypothetical protein